MAPPQSRAKSTALSVGVLASGAVPAAVTACTLAIAERTFERDIASVVVLVATYGLFVGQLINAAVIDARLSSGRPPRHVVVPRWLTLGALVSAGAMAVMPSNAWVVCAALPLMFAAIDVGRSVTVAERLDRREIAASTALALGLLGGVGVALTHRSWGFALVAVGVAVSVLVKARPLPFGPTLVDPSVRRWVITDVAVVGGAIPLINTLVRVTLGADAGLVFIAISTVSGFLAIPINYMRLRLLKSHSRHDVVIASVLFAVGTVAIVGANAAGVFARFFGDYWDVRAVIVPLVIACIWRAATLVSAIPFTALRRVGKVRRLTVYRALGSALAVVLAVVLAPLSAVAWVFAGLAVSEAVQAWLFERARRNLAPAEELTA